MLDKAKDYLQNILIVLGAQIDAGMPLVVLEPSCASVFQDELCNLFPTNERAKKLRSQTFALSDFLEKHAPNFQPPPLPGKAIMHGHCHQKSLSKSNASGSLLRKMGIEVQTLDSGCCGMAGPFGYDEDKFALSQAIGERVLLPAARQAAAETLIISDGFSCREQIEQLTGRHAVHVAEAIDLALSKTGNTAFE